MNVGHHPIWMILTHQSKYKRLKPTLNWFRLLLIPLAYIQWGYYKISIPIKVCAFDGVFVFVFENTGICIPSKNLHTTQVSICMVLEWTHLSKVHDVQTIVGLVSSFLDTTRVSRMRILQKFDTNMVHAFEYFFFVYETIGVCIPSKNLHTNYPFRIMLTRTTTWVLKEISHPKGRFTLQWRSPPVMKKKGVSQL
jgi:hypothetical protein